MRFLPESPRRTLKSARACVNFPSMLILLLKSPPPLWLPYVVFGGLLFAIVVLLWGRHAARRRREAFSAAAMQIGFSFELAGAPFSPSEASDFHLFTTGHSKEFHNILRGRTDGKDVLIFDYRYVTGGGKTQSTHQQTVAAFRLDGAHLPSFQLQPENLLHRLSALFGYQDIDFPEHPEFSRRYLLRGQNEAAVRAFFSPPVIDAFESLSPEARWSVEGGGNWLLVYHEGKRINPAEVPQFLQETASAASSLAQRTGAVKFGL